MVKAALLVVVVLAALSAGMYSWQSAEYEKGRRSVQLGWMLAPGATVSPDSREIDVLYIEPDCGSSGTLSTKVEYGQDAVAVGLLLDYRPGCLVSGGVARIQINLAEPIGNRELVPLDQANLTPEDFKPPPGPPTTDPAFENDPRL